MAHDLDLADHRIVNSKLESHLDRISSLHGGDPNASLREVMEAMASCHDLQCLLDKERNCYVAAALVCNGRMVV